MMKKTFTLLLLLSAGGLPAAQAQTVNYVTEIVTTYGGYWRSGDGKTNATTGLVNAGLNTIKPDNSHNLLSFTANGRRYATGVNNQLLTDKGLTFTATNFQALPVGAIGAPTTNTKVAVGQLYDGVDNGPSNPPPSAKLPPYLTDGPNGLDMGTGLANIPQGNLTFTVSGIQAAALADGVPDILVTQIASPSTNADVYSFLDAQGAVVGTKVSVIYDNTFPVVGNWTADFYEASQSPMTLAASFIKTDRPLRLWTAELSKFGITADNYSKITTFQILLSGDSDLAFVAYNKQSVTVLPVELTSFSGVARPDGQVRLAWGTASELHSERFVVETSTDGSAFEAVGSVVAAGTKTSATDYQFLHRPVATGLLYYRLHQFDIDGSSAYSPVVVVKVASVKQAVRAYPNPFDQTVRLALPAGSSGGEVQLLAVDGRTVYQHPFTTDELALPTCFLDVPKLQPGIYFLRVVLDGQVTLQKLVKE